MPYADKEMKKIYDQQYRLENWDKVMAYRKTPVVCDCGAVIKKHNFRAHQLTERHSKMLKEINFSK